MRETVAGGLIPFDGYLWMMWRWMVRDREGEVGSGERTEDGRVASRT